MGFADRFIASLDTSDLEDDVRHHKAGAAVSRKAECRNALASDGAQLERSVAHLAPLLRLLTEWVIKRGRAQKWVPESTRWRRRARLNSVQTCKNS